MKESKTHAQMGSFVGLVFGLDLWLVLTGLDYVNTNLKSCLLILIPVIIGYLFGRNIEKTKT